VKCALFFQKIMVIVKFENALDMAYFAVTMVCNVMWHCVMSITRYSPSHHLILIRILKNILVFLKLFTML